MDQDILPDEFNRSITKLDKVDLRRELATGWGATTGGQALTRRYHEQLTEGVRLALLRPFQSGGKADPTTGLVPIVRGLSPELIALCGIQTVLHSIGMRETFRDTLMSLGDALANECWGAKLTEEFPAEAAWITRTVKLKYAGVKRRLEVAQETAEKLAANGKLVGFKTRRWSRKSRLIAGAWLWNIVGTSLSDVFVRGETAAKGYNTEYMITLTESAWSTVDACLDYMVTSNPVFWPSAQTPKPWTGWSDGGSWDPRVSADVLRSNHRDTQAAVKLAIADGTMQPTLDALNALQSVAYTINAQVLEVLQLCHGYGIAVKGLVPEKLKRPVKPQDFATLDKAQQNLWHRKRAEIDQSNRSLIGDRVLFAEDMVTAEAMAKQEAFYTPMNCDWRGRVYALSHFNFQREDRVRALFLFADGQPIGTEGIEWLKIHTANCGDFKDANDNKISKRPLEERSAWCDLNGPLITSIASAPLVHTEWMQADKPFLFLAACFELSAAWAQGSSYMTRLPISFDGSCSGLQHLCAMTRAAEGSMVNLTPSPLPQDVYQQIADDAFETITADTENADLAKLFLDYEGDRRKGVKRNVMTYAYSSKKFGMAAQQQVDLMEPLAREVLEGKHEEHPFEGYQHGPYDKHGNQQPSKAARYFAGIIFDAIEKRIDKPAKAMKFLQDIAKALAHEGKPVRWTTPVGIPWINRYHAPEMTRVQLYLNDGGVKISTQVLLTTGSKHAIDKDKAANGVAPNFVHALDAAHLLLVASAAKLEGICNIATVHDSFGCLAPQATRFNAIIREQFALMYERNDVLTQILERASADLTQANRNRLPTRPDNGPLNLKDILDADFAFA